jgi:hypothetical protein
MALLVGSPYQAGHLGASSVCADHDIRAVPHAGLVHHTHHPVALAQHVDHPHPRAHVDADPLAPTRQQPVEGDPAGRETKANLSGVLRRTELCGVVVHGEVLAPQGRRTSGQNLVENPDLRQGPDQSVPPEEVRAQRVGRKVPRLENSDRDTVRRQAQRRQRPRDAAADHHDVHRG